MASVQESQSTEGPVPAARLTERKQNLKRHAPGEKQEGQEVLPAGSIENAERGRDPGTPGAPGSGHRGMAGGLRKWAGKGISGVWGAPPGPQYQCSGAEFCRRHGPPPVPPTPGGLKYREGCGGLAVISAKALQLAPETDGGGGARGSAALPGGRRRFPGRGCWSRPLPPEGLPGAAERRAQVSPDPEQGTLAGCSPRPRGALQHLGGA